MRMFVYTRLTIHMCESLYVSVFVHVCHYLHIGGYIYEFQLSRRLLFKQMLKIKTEILLDVFFSQYSVLRNF